MGKCDRENKEKVITNRNDNLFKRCIKTTSDLNWVPVKVPVSSLKFKMPWDKKLSTKSQILVPMHIVEGIPD